MLKHSIVPIEVFALAFEISQYLYYQSIQRLSNRTLSISAIAESDFLESDFMSRKNVGFFFPLVIR